MSSTLTINANLASLGVQRRLANSTAALQQSFERLSSGLRINKASDDAAGLSIASSLNVDSRVYSQGVRNTNDSLSFYSIAEGALNSLVDITIRLKELAQQSSNGVLAATQRKSLDKEAQAIGLEYQRIINATQFNGQNIINGGNGPLSTQVAYSTLTLSGGNASTGTFTGAQAQVIGSGGDFVTSGDFNGDGIVDLISGDHSGPLISVSIGNGNGSFRAAVTYNTNAGPYSGVAVDVNGDSILDFVAADSSTGRSTILLGNSNGTFKTAQQLPSLLNNARSVATGDVNGDGAADLIFSDYGSGHMNVLVGNGNGTFRISQDFTAISGPFNVVMADFNGDGLADLASADRNELSVYQSNGNGTFQAAKIYSAPVGERSVTTGDVNGDGIADLITSIYDNDQISILIGNGNGSFKVAGSYATGTSPKSVVASDVNGDGITDLISGDYIGSQLSVLIGNGNGSFRAGQAYANGNLVNAITAADLNGDGITDLISSTYRGNVGVFFGNGSAQAVVAPTTGSFSLLSRQSSLEALTQFGKILGRLTASIGQVGANESRLQVATSVLQQARINFVGAASQIQDVDVATEAANLAKGSILQQAGAAILAQANQQPGLALQLLQGIR